MLDFTNRLRKLLNNFSKRSVGADALKAIAISGLFSVGVKGVGLVKEMTLANYFGVSPEMDLYVFVLLVTTFLVGPVAGTLGTLLTQKYVELKQSDYQLSAMLYCQVINVISAIFIFIFVLQILFVSLPFVNFSLFHDASEISFFYKLILLPIGFFSAVSAINRAAITAEKKFVLFSMLPAFVPFTIIIFLFSDPASNLYLSLLIGSAVGYCVEMICGFLINRRILHAGFRHALDFSSTALREIKHRFAALFSARIVMAGCLVVDQFMAMLAGEGALSLINYGNRVPLGIISLLVIIWTVLFPLFSELASQRKFQQLLRLYLRSVFFALFGVMTLCALLVIYSSELISFLFYRGEFTIDNVILVGKIQGIYFLHIPFYVVCLISICIANSVEKPKVILAANTASLMFNVVFNLVFIHMFGVLGIAFATVLSYSVMAVIWIILAKQLITNSHVAIRE